MMTKTRGAALTLFAAILLAAAAKLAGYDVGLEYVLAFLTETEQ